MFTKEELEILVTWYEEGINEWGDVEPDTAPGKMLYKKIKKLLNNHEYKTSI